MFETVGRAMAVITIMNNPMGTFIKNIPFHGMTSNNTPPTPGPIAKPNAEPADITAIPVPTSLPVKFSVQRIGPDEHIMAAPTPCDMRNINKVSNESDIPHSNEAAVNTAKPHNMTRFGPMLVDILAKTTNSPANVNMYEVVIQDIVDTSMPNSDAMVGMAMLTMLPSNPSMNVDTNTTTIIRRMLTVLDKSQPR